MEDKSKQINLLKRRIARTKQLESILRNLEDERMELLGRLSELNVFYNKLQQDYEEMTGHIYIRNLYWTEEDD